MDHRTILHVDMDAFYASVEVLDNPSLNGKPVIVGGSPANRGVVSAASYEARKFGVHSAMPAAQARRLCPQGIFLPPRMGRYEEISGRIFEIFHSFTPLVEGLSLDEAFLDVTGCLSLFGPAEGMGRAIKARIRDELGLTASVGLAPNKFLAKVASDLEKPDGFVVIEAAGAASRLAPLPVGRLWGVGKVTQKALKDIGVNLVSDLFTAPRDRLAAVLGSGLDSTLALARGEDDRPVVPDAEARSHGAEETFSHDIGVEEELLRRLDGLAFEVAQRLRSSGVRARTVQIKARFPDFTTVTRALSLDQASNATLEIRGAARTLLTGHLDRQGRPLRLLGVSASSLEREEIRQGSLFDEARRERDEKIDRLVDGLQERFGRKALRQGKGSVPRMEP